MKTLKQKLEQIIEMNGSATLYMNNMMHAIEQIEVDGTDYITFNDSVIKSAGPIDGSCLSWSLEHCIGEYALINDIVLFD